MRIKTSGWGCAIATFFTAFFLLSGPLQAQVPAMINYQGKVQVSGTDYNGTGQFKFALVNGDGSTSYWSNDESSKKGSQPDTAVSLPVTQGVYSLQLGNTALVNMLALSPAIFSNTDVRLRVWFSDGVNGFQALSPDSKLVAVPYAIVAGNVANQSVGTSQLSSDIQQQLNGLLSWQDANKPNFTLVSQPTFFEDVATTWTLTAGNAPSSWTDVNNSLPPGLTINNQGVISGTPGIAGTYSTTITAANAAGSRSTNLTITVQPALYVDAVNGADANPGTRSQPVKTLNTAVQKAAAQGKGSIRLSSGNYTTTTLRITNMVVKGAYNAAQNWVRNLSQVTQVTQVTGGGAGDSSVNQGVFRLAGNSTLDGLNITSANSASVGYSSVGVVLENGTVRISDCNITAGNAGNGANGAAGVNGRNGKNGENGGSFGQGAAPTVSLYGASGGNGGRGTSSSGIATRGGWGSVSDRELGANNYNQETPGQAGLDGVNGTFSGSSTIPFGPSIIAVDSSFGVGAGNAQPGRTGFMGEGGAGGFGGNATIIDQSEYGGGGGAGGEGGEGGKGGAPGQNGSASIALLIASDLAVVQLEKTRLVSSAGGSGGTGGAGGTGGIGGTGGVSGPTHLASSGGHGGKGGNGDPGTAGSEGSGGPSYPLAAVSGASINSTSVTYVVGTGGAAGGPRASAGEATEMKITFPKLP